MPTKKLKQVNYKKFKKGKIKKLKFKVNNLKFGTLGLKAMQSGVIKLHQLNSAKQAIYQKIKKQGKLWINICTNFSITSKPMGKRMGKGKGAICNWISKISRGSIIFEICTNNYNDSFLALYQGSSKLPIKTKIVKN